MRLTTNVGSVLRTLPLAVVVAGAFTGVALLVGSGAMAVYYGNVNVNNSHVINSNINGGSFNGSNIINSNINNSTISNSTINNSNVANTRVGNSQLFNSNVVNANILNSFAGNSAISNANVGNIETFGQAICNTNDVQTLVSDTSSSTNTYLNNPTCPPLPQTTTNNATNQTVTNTANSNAAAAPVTVTPCLDSFSVRGPFNGVLSSRSEFIFTSGTPGVYQICISDGVIYVAGPIGAVVTISRNGSSRFYQLTLTGTNNDHVAISKIPS